MGRLAVLVGIDEKTWSLISAVGASLFVLLILVGFALAIGDAIKLIRYYVRDWSSDDGGTKSSSETELE